MALRKLSPGVLYPLAAALAVIGAKCWLIAGNGDPVPFWDEWDDHGAIVFPKYLSGTLHVTDLLFAHAEHRFFFARLWALLLLTLQGYWDPIAQMLANTLLLGAFVALLILAVRPVLTASAWAAFAVLTAVIYGLPFGWETTLSGFNSFWYFMLLFSLGGLFVISQASALSARWWMAMLLLVFGYFSMAGGALAPFAALATCGVQFLLRRRSGGKEVLGLAALAALGAAMMLAIPATPDSGYKAQSAAQFLQALLKILGWPLVHSAPIYVFVLGAIVVHLPAVAMCLRLLAQRPPLSDPRWRLMMLAAWLAAHAVALGYGRAANPMSARYLDVYVLALLLDAACILYYLDLCRGRQRQLIAGAGIAWVTLLGVGTTIYIRHHTVPELSEEKSAIPDQIANLRAFLDTGDIAALENKPLHHIPLPDPQRLAQIASSPVIRAVLPPVLVGEASVARAQQHGLARLTGHAVEAMKHAMLRWGAWLVPAGALLFLLGYLGAGRRAAGPHPT